MDVGLEVMKHNLERLCIDLLIQMMVQTCAKILINPFKNCDN